MLKSNTLATWCEEPTHLKRPWCWERWRQEKSMIEDELVGWHHQLDGHESEQALGVGDGQGSLVCCSRWGHKESDTTEWLSNWTELIHSYTHEHAHSTHTCTCSRMCTHIHTTHTSYTHMLTHRHTLTHVHTSIYTWICTYTHILVHTYTHACMYILYTITQRFA